jgi:cephalosporin hydroxylase
METLRRRITRKVSASVKRFRKPYEPVDQTEGVTFNASSIARGHHLVTYRGVKSIRCPFDYVIYQMILSELRPDLVIEIGTNIGGGALYLADLMELLGHGMVHTIDVVRQSNELLWRHPRIKLFTQGWENYDITEAKQFTTVLVIEDGSHFYKDTLGALRQFAPAVTPGSYMIVEDGILNELGMEQDYGGGPLKAIREYLAETSDFVVDRRWCDLFGHNATFNVNGYLKKRA